MNDVIEFAEADDVPREVQENKGRVIDLQIDDLEIDISSVLVLLTPTKKEDEEADNGEDD